MQGGTRMRFKRRTACGACAREDGAAGNVGAHADQAVVALTLGDGRFIAVAVHSS